jgi:hypothetical protein
MIQKHQLKVRAEPGMVVHAYNSSYRRENGGIVVRGQPGQNVSKDPSQPISQLWWPVFVVLSCVRSIGRRITVHGNPRKITPSGKTTKAK